MPLPKVIPALADLTQDIAGPIPIQLLQNWASGAQDADAAATLLEAYQCEGTVVSSDTSGLTRMTKSMELLDVLSLISAPKEIIHSLGCEIGGRGIGTWVADNTEMFYADTVSPLTVVDAMGEAQARIQERTPARIGMCVHRGRFFEIGGGLYGPDADRVEYLAEHCAGGGEILLTDSIAAEMKARPAAKLREKQFGDGSLQAWIIDELPRLPHLNGSDKTYPHPFPDEFFHLLPRLKEDGLKETIYSRWLRDRVVVFVARELTGTGGDSLTALLDGLVINALMETLVRETAPDTDNIASSSGGIAILTFDTTAEALAFSRILRARLQNNGLAVRIGIDAGPVLLFQNARGPSGITGDPINIASKLSEDAGRAGIISITDRAAQTLSSKPSSERFEVRTSGVTLTGIEVS